MINLIHGDCLIEMQNILDGSVDLILTDPPYGTTACKWDSVIPLEPMWEQLKRIIKPNGAIVLFGSEPFSSALRMSNIKNYKYDWIWKKNMPSGIMLTKTQPMRIYENIHVFYSKVGVFNRQLTETIIKDRKIVEGRKNGSTSEHTSSHHRLRKMKQVQKTMVSPRNILEEKCVPNSGGRKVHPTQKPVALMEYLIKTYTNEGETVLDFTMGSGTTGVACKRTNRKFIGIEKDDKYFEIAKNRIETHSVQPELMAS
jgi:site-specific DNA-methyltransferase (adenine-specific)